MYSQQEKKRLMEELKEMESLKVDVGDEGIILQNDFAMLPVAPEYGAQAEGLVVLATGNKHDRTKRSVLLAEGQPDTAILVPQKEVDDFQDFCVRGAVCDIDERLVHGFSPVVLFLFMPRLYQTFRGMSSVPERNLRENVDYCPRLPVGNDPDLDCGFEVCDEFLVVHVLFSFHV